jgi:hydrogenase expression/formation protein HypD
MITDTKDLFEKFRDSTLIAHLAKQIATEAAKLDRHIRIMEVCGGHTHTIMKYGLLQLLPQNVSFVHGPGCPVCIMPKERIDHAMALAKVPDVIVVTLGDMVKVPGSEGSLQKVRSQGADVRFLYSPMDALTIAKENPTKKVIYFAIGFETTTPMTAALVERAVKEGITNLLFHINHVLVPPPVCAIMDAGDALIDAFIGPAHVTVITGAKIYAPIVEKYKTPIVASGFEPVDVLQSVVMIVRQFVEKRCELEIQYSRSVTMDGNLMAQAMMERVFELAPSFRWRGLGDIPLSSLKLKDEYAKWDAEVVYNDILPQTPIDDHKLCICGEILKGKANPKECKVFGTACTPATPMGSCMVSSEGACAAYYKYGRG